MNIDRNIAPATKPIKQISFPPLETTLLSGGIPVYYLNMGDQDVSRVDIMIGTGKWEQPKPLVSSFTNLLTKEGAGKMDGKAIAETLDYYGAWLQLSDGFHYSYITVYTLNKFFRETIEILFRMFREPHFPEEAFENLKNRRKQQFFIDNSKVQYLANKAFSEALFGAKHPYGRTSNAEDFDRIQISDLKEFHQKHYYSGNISIVLSGKITDEMLKIVEESAESSEDNIQKTCKPTDDQVFEISPENRRRIWVEKPDAMQNGIRMGIPVVNRSHPDFPGLRVLNTILGGYFGSRLMSNIREEKGYTYGISSGITTLKHAAYWSIATQTACEHTENLIREVYHEIDRLHREVPGKQEMETVRNYMLGDFTRSLDGTFSLIDAYISLLASGMTTDFFHQQVETVKNISPEEIKNLARRYLNKESIIEIIAGK